ncbi:unnamed protein product [Rotaria sp. Silwood2]|nr:unnamed protein product [Rotaria sp. Silwood2]CAF4507743.1 unnamed protein product [Rotaria sp. Silwood2]
MAPKKNQTSSINDKYSIVKPTLDLSTARITQCGTEEFRDHLTFLNIVLDLINVNKFKELHNYAINLECKDMEQLGCKTEPHFITKSNDDIQQESPTKQTVLNYEETVEKQQDMKINLEAPEQEYETELRDEYEEALLNLELTQEEAKDEDQSLSTNQLILSYSPVINPRGRSRDLQTYKYKRNEKVKSVLDVYDNTTWLTDLHIRVYLFFELLKKEFPNINGLCGPAQIHLYKCSLENSIFIFNANSNHWITVANLESENIWKVHDSLSYPKESLVKFFQDILPGEEKVVLSFENVQQQVGGHDCGLFALTFATSLCYGDIPSSLFYDQKSLRNHYVNCIENNEIQRFSSKPKRGSTRNNCKLVDLYLK